MGATVDSGPHVCAPIDANSNLTSDGTRTFEWDAINRLAAVNVGTQRSEFTYDGLHRRVRVVEKASGATVRDAVFFWANGEIIEERVSTGEVNRFFGDGEQHNGAARFIGRDHLGSVRDVANASGALLTQNDYDPYGQLTRSGGTEDSRFGYTGHMMHAPSVLALAQYRAYDAQLGLWISQDPLGFGGGDTNLFGYVGRKPLERVDPDGRIPLDLVVDIITTGIDAYCGRWDEVVIDVIGMATPYLSASTLKQVVKVAKAGRPKNPSQIDRTKFRNERQNYWKQQAKSRPEQYTPDNLDRMKQGRPPLGPDGHPMELHHVDRTPDGGTVPMTRTDHRLGPNFKKNHP